MPALLFFLSALWPVKPCKNNIFQISISSFRRNSLPSIRWQIAPLRGCFILPKRSLKTVLFRDIEKFLRPGDLLVANNTRVIKARLLGAKATEELSRRSLSV